LPSRVYSLSGPASLIAYIICAVAVSLIVLCFAEVSSRFTETGGPYLYAREAFGPLVGFEVGWIRWLAGVTAFAANTNLMVDYLSYFWPTASGDLWHALLVTASTLALTSINLIGVRDSAVASNVFAVAKLLPLLLFLLVGFFFVDPQALSIAVQPGYGALSASVLLVMYAFAGFESMPVPAGEVRDPQRNVPFALFTTIAVVMALYLSIQVVCIGTLPELASSARPLADAGNRFLGPFGGLLISAGAVVSIAGNLNAQLLATPRVLFAMAEQRQVPRMLAAVHKRFHTPYSSILLSSAVSLVFALSGTFVQLLTLSVLARLTVYAATCAALPVLRRKGNVPPPVFKAPWGIALAVASVALCLWLLSSSTGREALTALIAVAIGLLIFFAYKIMKPAEP
jgi:amino acid transporter